MKSSSDSDFELPNLRTDPESDQDEDEQRQPLPYTSPQPRASTNTSTQAVPMDSLQAETPQGPSPLSHAFVDAGTPSVREMLTILKG